MAILVLALGGATCVAADNYPSRPIRIIVPWPAGGSGDVRTRQMAERLSKSLGQSVIVENKAGASGAIGIDYGIKAAPDGYTILWGSVSDLVVVSAVNGNSTFDLMRDLRPITRAVQGYSVLLVNPRLGVNSVVELVALAKSRPGQLDHASAGNGSIQHVTGALFARSAGIDIVHVPYKGEAPALTDLLSGQVPMMFGFLPATLGHIQAGKRCSMGSIAAPRACRYSMRCAAPPPQS